jgi:hypothetical protein
LKEVVDTASKSNLGGEVLERLLSKGDSGRGASLDPVEGDGGRGIFFTVLGEGEGVLEFRGDS